MNTPDDHAETVGGGGSPKSAPRRWRSLEIRQELGHGSFGVVYRAWDPQLAREVALKIVSSDLTNDQAASADILAEARRLASVRHTNVVIVYGADAFENSIGLWMELVEGRTLRQLVGERGVFGASEALAVGIDVCAAVAAVHNAGLVHRDIKADNIMREQGGRIVLMDFGCGAGRTDRLLIETMAGTPQYWAPEILEGQPATVRTDVYSIGVLLFYLLTHRYPVTGRTAEQLRKVHREGRPERLHDARPDLPAPLIAAIERATDSNPSRRPATAGELRAALVAANAWLPAVSAASVSEAATTRAAAGPRRGHRILAGVVVAALVAAASGVYLWRARSNRLSSSAGTGRIESIVVLPFTDLTGDANQAYLATAVAQELTNALEERGEVRTIPFTYVRQLVDQHRDMPDIVTRTGADGMIEGSVEIVPAVNVGGRMVRISTNLRQARGGSLIWKNSSDNQLGRLLPATSIIADEVATRVGAALAARRNQRPARIPASADSETMELYLRGREALARADSSQRLLEAIDYFNRAVSRNERFVPAYTAIANAYANLSGYWNALDGRTAYDRVMANTTKALTFDDADPQVWASRAYGEFFLAWEWTRAAEDFGRALSLGANSDGVRREYLNFLTAVGRHADSIAQGEAIATAFPALPDSHRAAAWAFYFGRQYDAAIEQSQTALRINPDYTLARTLLVRAYSAKGMHDEAIAALRPLAESSRGRPYRPMLSYVLAAAGQRAEALTVLNGYLSSGGTQLDYEVSIAYATLGMPDKAMALLDRCYQTRNPQLVNVAVDPRMDPLRPRQDFQGLIRRMHFPESISVPSTQPKKERVDGDNKPALRQST